MSDSSESSFSYDDFFDEDDNNRDDDDLNFIFHEDYEDFRRRKQAEIQPYGLGASSVGL